MFDGVAPNLQQAVQAFKDEAQAWQCTGAKGLSVTSRNFYEMLNSPKIRVFKNFLCECDIS